MRSKRYWFDASYGGVLLSEYLHLASLFGSRKNILLGSCGGLSEQVNACDVIVPTASYGDESTTRMYQPHKKDNLHEPNRELSHKLAVKMERSHKVWLGATVTNQAMMAETNEHVELWSKQGYLGVEMEAATVFAVSNHFTVPSAAVLLVGDNLVKGESVLSSTYAELKSRRLAAQAEQYIVATSELLS